MSRFRDRIALVTGASRGLGRAIAVALAREGASVLVAYRSRQDQAEQTIAAITGEGGDAHPHPFDVSDADAVQKAVDTMLSAHERVDVLINCAGIARDQRFPMLDPADFRDVVNVNLQGALHVSRALVRSMIARKRGSIVNIASIAGLRASPGQASYAASKGGLIALTRTMGAELAPHGIRVNAVVPGLFDAGMATRLDHRIRDARLAQIPAGRFGAADELARAVLFLASDDASYIVGQTLVVDGGLTA